MMMTSVFACVSPVPSQCVGDVSASRPKQQVHHLVTLTVEVRAPWVDALLGVLDGVVVVEVERLHQLLRRYTTHREDGRREGNRR